jgi:hypothetical protein
VTNGPDEYKFVLSGRQRERIRLFLDMAEAAGFLEKLIANLEYVDHQLRHHPTEWGEPKYLLAGLDLIIYHGMHGSLSLYYGVNEAKRLVILQSITLVSEPHPDD